MLKLLLIFILFRIISGLLRHWVKKINHSKRPKYVTIRYDGNEIRRIVAEKRRDRDGESN